MPGRKRGIVSIVLAFSAFAAWSPATAETASERNACFGDAFRVCWSAIPSREEVFACLMQNRNLLSEPCRLVMDQYRHPHRHRRPTRYTRVSG